MKLNFFTKIYLAITDFRLYPYVVQKEKWRTSFAYFFCFMMLIAIVLATNITVKTLNWTYEFLEVYPQTIPEFSIDDGRLITSANQSTTVAGVNIVLDDTRQIKENDLKDFDFSEGKMAILIYQDGWAIGKDKLGLVGSKYDEVGLSIDKSTLYEDLMAIMRNPLLRIAMVGVLFVSIFSIYLITRGLFVLGITLILLFLGYVFKLDYRLKDYMKIAFYVITLPIITEVIAFLVVGEINQYATITYHLLCYIYMFYAVRALKLDSIITATQEKIMDFQKEKTPEKESTKESNQKEDTSVNPPQEEKKKKEKSSEEKDEK